MDSPHFIVILEIGLLFLKNVISYQIVTKLLPRKLQKVGILFAQYQMMK